jgi:hypothetical protein
MLRSFLSKAITVAAVATGVAAYANESQAQTVNYYQNASNVRRTVTDPGGSGWTYVEFTDAMCRNGKPAGIVVRPGADTTKVVITMQGGGLCYSGATCAVNQSDFGDAGFTRAVAPGGSLSQGIWDKSHGDSLLPNFTHVFVPYCTGDFHAGNVKNVRVDGTVQQFVGAQNTETFATYLKSSLFPQLSRLQEVKLAGFSAGGFGALFNAQRIKKAVPAGVTYGVILDSSPPFKTETSVPTRSPWDPLGFTRAPLFRSCMQKRIAETWNVKSWFTEYCSAGCTTSNWVNPVFQSLLTSLPDVPVTFLSNGDDPVVEVLTGIFGDPLCTNLTVPGAPAFAQGLKDLKNQMAAARGSRNNWGTYYDMAGYDHCFINRSDKYFNTTVSAMPLQNWVQKQFSSYQGPANFSSVQ